MINDVVHNIWGILKELLLTFWGGRLNFDDQIIMWNDGTGLPFSGLWVYTVSTYSPDNEISGEIKAYVWLKQLTIYHHLKRIKY